MKGKKDMRQVDIERLIFVVQGITYIHTLSLRTYAAAIVLKMAKVEKTAQSTIRKIRPITPARVPEVSLHSPKHAIIK